MTKVPPESKGDLYKQLDQFLPWPEEAISCYSVFSYTEQLDQSLVQYLRESLGKWWSEEMHHPEGGMSQLPEVNNEALVVKVPLAKPEPSEN